MRQRLSTWVAVILLVILVSALIDFWPGSRANILGLQLDFPTKLGLDLQGGLQVVLQARNDPTTGAEPTTDRMQAARDIIDERVNALGVSEPIVQLQGSNRIVVELPGVTDPALAIATIRETGQLEWIDSGSTPLSEGQLVTTANGGPTADQIRQVIGDPTATPDPNATQPVLAAGTPVTDTGVISATATVQPTATIAATATPDASVAAASPTPFGGTVYPVVITGADIDGTGVRVSLDPTTGSPQVEWTLKGDGPQKMADFTASHIGQYMPIVLDKRIIASPIIQSAIPGGQGVINQLSQSEASKLAIQLKYGALPVALDVVLNRTIGATLGQDSIDASLIAGIIGLSIVMFFMLFYYRLPGLLADIALLVFTLITFAAFKLIGVVLTLAGIAGFILSIGMAVDANVLIFARMKEELRTGKTIRAAVEAGFDHAWPSIRDSNVTTVIICLILYWFGSFFGASVIRGFALTLLISVLISMFTAITVTRTLMRLILPLPLIHNKWWYGVVETNRQLPPADSGTATTVS